MDLTLDNFVNLTIEETYRNISKHIETDYIYILQLWVNICQHHIGEVSEVIDSYWLQRVPPVGCAQRVTLFSSSTGTSSGSESASHVLGQPAGWFWTWRSDMVNVHKVLWDSWQSYYYNLLYIYYIYMYCILLKCYMLCPKQVWPKVLKLPRSSVLQGCLPNCWILPVLHPSSPWEVSSVSWRNPQRLWPKSFGFGMVILYDFLTCCWLVKHCLGSQLISQQLGPCLSFTFELRGKSQTSWRNIAM